MSENVMKKGFDDFLVFLKKIEEETKAWPDRIKRSALHLFASDDEKAITPESPTDKETKLSDLK